MTDIVATNTRATTDQVVPRAGTGWLWAGLFAGLSLFVAFRMDAFHWFEIVQLPGGVSERIPVGYASIDHPFHATRAETVRRALADGEILRWIGHHQGGYPVEFYPLGIAWLEVGMWALLFGSLPIILIHKLTIIAIFLLPGIAYLFFCRRDRLTPGIALLAFTVHVAVGGWWWSGGYMELVLWGLVTNVAANVALLFAFPALTSYLKDGNRRAAAAAILVSAFALVSNPRSFIALATIFAGVAAAVALNRSRDGLNLADLSKRIGVVVLAIGMLAAPELISLLRFSDLYYFVHYQGYESIREFADSSIQAVSGPVFVFAIVGTVLALAVPGRTVTRATAISLILYAVITAYLSTESAAQSLVDQLENTRLMPFQRFLMIFVAAVGAFDTFRWILGQFGARRATEAALVGLSAAVLILYVISPPSFIPEGDRGLYEVPSTANPVIADLQLAVEQADESAPPGTALLVLGQEVSWHDALWSPTWSDRPFFYDDWLWYWQTKHYGDYDPTVEHAYEREDSPINAEYLQRHGIGAVVVIGDAEPTAKASPLLSLVREGLHDVYVVRDPTSVVTFDGLNAEEFVYDNEHMTASGVGSGGTATIRRNWFPRWSAEVNGERVPITETDDGYMTVPIPEGDVDIELTYVVDRWDWLARLMSLVGFVSVLVLLIPRRWLTREASGRKESGPPQLNLQP